MITIKNNSLTVFTCLVSLINILNCWAISTENIVCTASSCSVQKINHKAEMLGVATGYLLSRALYTAAKLGVADLMSESRPVHVAELAQQISVHAPSLYRLLRMLAGHEIFKETTKNYFILTPKALCLTSYHESSIRDIILGEDNTRWNAVGNLDKAIQSGQPAFDQIYGKSYFQYITDKPELSSVFDAHMSQLTREEDYAILDALVVNNSMETVADIGGGRGSFLAKILRKYSHLKGILYDLPVVINNQKELLLGDTKNRVEALSGSFFESVPVGADLYILKRVLHDWNDEECKSILEQIKKAMSSTSTLYVIDAVLPDDNSAHIGKDIDIFLMAIFSGKERTKADFEELFTYTGLMVKQIYPTSAYISIIELKLANTK